MGRRAALEINANVEAAPPPEESGGDGAASLFDATADARVRILRREDATQKFVTHGYFPPEVNEETVNAAFGGGYYKAQLVIPDPASGRLMIKRVREFKIPGVYKPPQKIADFADATNANGAAPAAAASLAALPVGGGDDLMQVLKAGIINTLLEMMKSTKEMNNRPTVDPLMAEVMKAQAATQATMMQSQQQMMQFMLTLATKDGGGDRKEMLAEMLKYKELFTANNGAVPADPMKMFTNMLDVFKTFRETADEVNPPRDTGDPIMDSIPKLVEVVAEQHALNKAAREQAGQRITSRPVQANGGVAHMPEVSTLPPQPELAMWQRILRQQSARLIASAAAKHDPDVIAGTAILFAPPAVKEALMLFFHREEPEIMADMFAEIPALTEHREWLGEFIECAQARLFPDEFTDEDDAEVVPEGEAKGGDE